MKKVILILSLVIMPCVSFAYNLDFEGDRLKAGALADAFTITNKCEFVAAAATLDYMSANAFASPAGAALLDLKAKYPKFADTATLDSISKASYKIIAFDRSTPPPYRSFYTETLRVYVERMVKSCLAGKFPNLTKKENDDYNLEKTRKYAKEVVGETDINYISHHGEAYSDLRVVRNRCDYQINLANKIQMFLFRKPDNPLPEGDGKNENSLIIKELKNKYPQFVDSKSEKKLIKYLRRDARWVEEDHYHRASVTPAELLKLCREDKL